MSKAVKRGAGTARHRILGAFASLAIGGATVFVPGVAAQAAPDTADRPSGSLTARPTNTVALPHDKMPKGAVRATGERLKPGAHGPAFQKPVSVSSRSITPNVVGGELASAADYPWIVGIQTMFWGADSAGNEGWWVSTCTGTVLSPTKVLTAAHCIVGLPFASTDVIAGRNVLSVNDGGFVARVASTWTHQNFNIAALNSGAADVPIDDVSVLTLKNPLPAAYTPVELSDQGDQSPYAEGTEALIVGYGVTGRGAGDSGTLRKATVSMQSDATCSTDYGADYDGNRMICAGAPGIDTCGGDSGGPILVNGVQVGITDWGPVDCGTKHGVYERMSYYADLIRVDLTRPPVVNMDWSGDGISDLWARKTNGDLYKYDGSGLANDGKGGFAGSALMGSGWQDTSKLFRVTNWNGDGNPSLMAMESDGTLWQYHSDGKGDPAGTPTVIGTGWNIYADIMVTNNWTGNGRPNLMARKSNGDLYLYTSNGAGGWMNNGIGIKIGTGWNTFNTVLTPGTWAGDGHQALIGRNSKGELMLYKSNGAGGWMNGGIGVRIGTGWNIFKVFMSPGDWNGDNMVDLIGITSGGVMSVYKTDGYGNWLNNGMGQQIGTGWNIYNTVF